MQASLGRHVDHLAPLLLCVDWNSLKQKLCTLTTLHWAVIQVEHSSLPETVVAAQAGGKVKQKELSETSSKTLGLPQSTCMVEQIEQVGGEPEVVQAEAELPHHLWYVGFQGGQQDRVKGGHVAKATKSVNCLGAMHTKLISFHSGQSVEQACYQPLVPESQSSVHVLTRLVKIEAIHVKLFH